MGSTKDQAVCIRHWDWSETSQTVSLFGRQTGLFRAIAKGSKRENAKFSGGLDLLTRGEAIAVIKPAPAMALLTAWDLLESFPAIRRSLSAFYSAMYLADALQHMVTEHDPHPALFDALLVALRSLGAGRDRNAVLRFQWALLVEAGYRPELSNDVATGRPLAAARAYGFSPAMGGVTADPSASADRGPRGPVWRVRHETVALLRSLDGGGEGAAPGEAVDRGARLLAAHIREILGRDIPSAGALFGLLEP